MQRQLIRVEDSIATMAGQRELYRVSLRDEGSIFARRRRLLYEREKIFLRDRGTVFLRDIGRVFVRQRKHLRWTMGALLRDREELIAGNRKRIFSRHREYLCETSECLSRIERGPWGRTTVHSLSSLLRTPVSAVEMIYPPTSVSDYRCASLSHRLFKPPSQCWSSHSSQ